MTKVATDPTLATGGCALASLHGGEEAIGTATPFHDVFLLQVAPPWARLALDTPGIPTGLRGALVPAARAGRRAYVLLVDSDDVPPPPAGTMRLLHARAEPVDDAAARFVRREYLVPAEDVARTIEAVAKGDEPPHAPSAVPPPARDQLVCTHGERDGCCGAFGEAAYRYLRDRHAGPDLRVWRVSHFGGHRFAPTLVDLPEGRCWGRLTPEVMDVLARREAAPATIAASYRGSCRLQGPVQAVERDLLVEHGWAWSRASWTIMAEAADTAGVRCVSVRYRLPGGPWTSRRAVVRPLPAVSVPASCGADEAPVVHYRASWEAVGATP